MDFFRYGPMSNKWVAWTVGGLLLVLLWFIIWSPPAPPPVKQVKKQAQGTKDRLYDLKVGPWQNRVDQDLEATRSQIEKMDSNQKEIKQELKLIADTLAILAR